MHAAQPHGLVTLPTGGTGPAVLVLHAWWGLNDDIRAVCDRLAASGFVAFAPDLYGGAVADTIPDAEALAGGIFDDLAPARAAVSAAAAYLGQHGGPIAVLGFSLGAFFALDLAERAPESVGAVVVYYGTHPEATGASRAAYLGHFAEHDQFEPPEAVDELERTLHTAGREVAFHRYAGTSHWFAEPGRADAYDAVAAGLAWERTLVFLQRFATARTP